MLTNKGTQESGFNCRYCREVHFKDYRSFCYCIQQIFLNSLCTFPSLNSSGPLCFQSFKDFEGPIIFPSAQCSLPFCIWWFLSALSTESTDEMVSPLTVLVSSITACLSQFIYMSCLGISMPGFLNAACLFQSICLNCLGWNKLNLLISRSAQFYQACANCSI